MSSREVVDSHNLLWKQFEQIIKNKKLAHALLLIGDLHQQWIEFAPKLAAAILCKSEVKPCELCSSCHLLRENLHPDLSYLSLDKVGGVIKIDQIRELQTIIYRSPQVSKQRVIIINPADKMNIAAANALLKLLEEPPADVYFILIAEHTNTILPTILSRCQQWRTTTKESPALDYLSIGENYLPDLERGKLFAQIDIFLQDLIALRASKTSVCALASKWSAFALSELLWLIYLINSQMIAQRLLRSYSEKDWSENLNKLAATFDPVQLFAQLDQLNALKKHLNNNISLNANLVIENLLLGYA